MISVHSFVYLVKLDIIFILSNIKRLSLVYFIINYITKRNCNQYQRIINIIIVKKIVKD